MCQSKANGGKRCAYADKMNAVRKKARREVFREKPDAGHYTVESAGRDAVRAWEEDHRDEVWDRLPQRQKFQRPALKSQKPVPEELKALLTCKGESVTGRDEETRVAHTRNLYDQAEEWRESLSREESNVVNYYAMQGFETINAMARGRSITPFLSPWDRAAEKRAEREERTKEQVALMDSALEKVAHRDEPQRLYRFFRVPAGVSPARYMERFFVEGEGFKDPGFLSTSADPEFVMAHMKNRNGGKRNKGYVVLEILSAHGGNMQPHETSRSGDVQSLESEVVLPRNSRLRVVGKRKSQQFTFGSNRYDLHSHYARGWAHNTEWLRRHYQEFGEYKEGDTLRYPMVQLIDEDLIRSHPE